MQTIGRRALVSFFASAGLACSKRPPAPAGPLRVGFIGTGQSAAPVGPEGWAFQQGTLAPSLSRHGFSRIDFARFANGPDLNEALGGGALDVGIYGDTPALVGRAAGLPTRLVNQSAVGLDAWLLVRADGPSSLAELAGRTVATSKGSYMHRYLAGLLEQQNLLGRVKFAHLLPSDAEAALQRGDVTAYAAPVQTAPLITARAGARVIDRASDHEGLVGTSVTVMTHALLDAHPELPATWNDLRAQAVADLKRHADEYYAFYTATVGVPRDVARVAAPLALYVNEPLGARGLALLEGTKRFLVKTGLAQADFAIRDWSVSGV